MSFRFHKIYAKRLGRHGALGILLLIAAAVPSCARKVETKQSGQASSPASSTKSERTSLRVCADPNNLPFSNDRLEGFENRIASLVARDLKTEVQYTWWAQRRGFFRNTLRAGACDLVMGVPSSFELALTTSPYYRSTYVFVYRRDRHLNIRSSREDGGGGGGRLSRPRAFARTATCW
jgi:ABC-type amino acid transport substrate-binding protein